MKKVMSVFSPKTIKVEAVYFLIACLLIAVPAYAGPVEWAKKGFVGILTDSINEIVNQVIQGVFDYIFSSINLNNLGIWGLVDLSEQIATALAITIFSVRGLKAMLDRAAGIGQDTPQQMLKDFATSIVMIYLSKYLIDWMLRLCNAMTEAIGTTVTLDFKTWVSALVVLPPTAGIMTTLLVLIFVVTLMISVVVAGIRHFEIAMLLVCGPILAATAANKGEAFNAWFRESIAVIFTQPVQYIILMVMMKWITGDVDVWKYLGAIGATIGLIKGPQVVRQFLWSSGAGGMVIGGSGAVSKMASYKFMATKMTGVK